MSILSEAWRRSRGEEAEVARALGAPPGGGPGGGGRWMPWAISAVLVVVATGLGVYVWRIEAGRGAAARTPSAAVAPATVAAAGAATARVHPAVAAPATPRTRGVAHRAAASGGDTGAETRPQPTAPRAGQGTAADDGSVPDAIRAALPALPVTVHVWNPDPSARFIIVHGHLYHEGADLGSGVTLVSITEAGEVVRFRGYLITLGGGQ